MRYWLGIVSREHAMRGVSLGIAQISHGKRPPLARLAPGDWLVYYSPREKMGESAALRAFTAVGEIVDDEIWQADEESFTPWRRRIRYLDGVSDAPLRELADRLELTRTPNWGHQLRRGLVELSEGDFVLIRSAMAGDE
jgi:EVE domain